MKTIIATSIGAVLLGATTLALADDVKPVPPAAAEAIVTTVCQNCHGPSGDSVLATFPRLNGQQSDYIVNQLDNFRDHKRGDPHAQAYMWGMASQLSDAQIAGLAKYFASQKPTEPQTGGALAAEGKDIFMNGAPAQNVPACNACHGDHGEGNSDIPRLAGQHSYYLKEQLEAFRSTLRQNDIMHANTKDMTDRQIEAIVSYLAND